MDKASDGSASSVAECAGGLSLRPARTSPPSTRSWMSRGAAASTRTNWPASLAPTPTAQASPPRMPCRSSRVSRWTLASGFLSVTVLGGSDVLGDAWRRARRGVSYLWQRSHVDVEDARDILDPAGAAALRDMWFVGVDAAAFGGARARGPVLPMRRRQGGRAARLSARRVGVSRPGRTRGCGYLRAS